jgi:hypothetical protein
LNNLLTMCKMRPDAIIDGEWKNEPNFTINATK